MEPLQNALKYRMWLQSLSASGVRMTKSVEEVYTLRKQNGEVLFSLVQSHPTDPDGHPFHGLCLLRGHFVCVLTCIRNTDTGARRLLLVRQRRICNGELFYEHPAGMMDADTDPYATAMKEVQEETGLHVTRQQLHLLNPELYYSSPGLLDEGGWFFWTELGMTTAQIAALQGAQRGAAHENEKILLHLATVDEALRLIKNIQGQLCIYLWLQQQNITTETETNT
jgi:hypothetical protein